MLSTFFKIYIRAKLPFRFFWGVSFRMNGVKERRGLVKKMGERDVLAEENRITYQPRLFSINPTKIFPENLSLELKMGLWFHYQTVFPWICLLLLDGKSNPSWIFSRWSNGYLRCSHVPWGVVCLILWGHLAFSSSSAEIMLMVVRRKGG